MTNAAAKFNEPQRSPAVTWILSLALFAFLVALTLLFLYCAACFDPQFNKAWYDLGAALIIMGILPPLGACCCILAVILMRRHTHRPFAVGSLAIAVPLGFPVTAFLLAKCLSAPAAQLVGPPIESFARARREREVRSFQGKVPTAAAIIMHYDALRAQFAEPQVISRAERGMILLEDHKILQLYGVYYSSVTTADLMTYVSQNLINKRVVIRLPPLETFMLLYKPERIDEPRDGSGYRYGMIPCFVYVDGRLLNSRYNNLLSDYGAE